MATGLKQSDFNLSGPANSRGRHKHAHVGTCFRRPPHSLQPCDRFLRFGSSRGGSYLVMSAVPALRLGPARSRTAPSPPPPEVKVVAPAGRTPWSRTGRAPPPPSLTPPPPPARAAGRGACWEV